MNKQQASLLLMKKVIVPESAREAYPAYEYVTREYVSTFNANLMSLGYVLSLEVIDACTINLTKDQFLSWADELQRILVEYNGARQNMVPMYPNFPLQVIEASDLELHINALLHYISSGTWLPRYENLIKLRTRSVVKPKVIGLTDEKELMWHIKSLAQMPVSMSSQQKEIFDFLVEEYRYEFYLNTMIMPNKENMAHVIHKISKLTYGDDKNIWHKHLASHNIKTITDVLRLAVAYLGGDPSLTEQCVFSSIKRADRRFLLGLIDRLYFKNHAQVLEDAARYQGLWVIVLEQLHPGDYAKRYIFANQFAKKVREDKLRTWYSKLEKAYANNNLNKVVTMLEKRPGEFARRLERTIRLAYEDDISGEIRAKSVIERFDKIADQVDRTILLQLVAYFKKQSEGNVNEIRTFFPKGKMSKIFIKEETRTPFDKQLYISCQRACERALIKEYSEKEDMGKVYIDPQINNFTVPLKLRNASNQLHTISRGSRMKLPEEANVIRLYTWWKNRDNERFGKVDIDLSATFYDENFDAVQKSVTYYNLKIDGCCHSGDITNAPDGAAEYINIDIKKLLDQKVRYIAMNINSFSNDNFCDLPECFAGVMALEDVNDKGQVFDPAKSFIRSDISTESTACIPMIFDLLNKEVIWVDSIVPTHSMTINNVNSHKDSITCLVRGILTASYPTMLDLITLNMKARNGILTDNKEDADIVFALDEGVTPYDLEIINNEWI